MQTYFNQCINTKSNNITTKLLESASKKNSDVQLVLQNISSEADSLILINCCSHGFSHPMMNIIRYQFNNHLNCCSHGFSHPLNIIRYLFNVPIMIPQFLCNFHKTLFSEYFPLFSCFFPFEFKFLVYFFCFRRKVWHRIAV